MDFLQDSLFNGLVSKKCLSLLVGKSMKFKDVRQELDNYSLCKGLVPERIQ